MLPLLPRKNCFPASDKNELVLVSQVLLLANVLMSTACRHRSNRQSHCEKNGWKNGPQYPQPLQQPWGGHQPFWKRVVVCCIGVISDFPLLQQACKNVMPFCASPLFRDWGTDDDSRGLTVDKHLLFTVKVALQTGYHMPMSGCSFTISFSRGYHLSCPTCNRFATLRRRS